MTTAEAPYQREVVQVGGQPRKRGLFGGRNTFEVAGLAACAFVAVVVSLSVGSLDAILVALVVLFVAWLLFTPFRVFRGSSPAARIAAEMQWRRRVRRGLTTFVPGQPAVRPASRAGKAKATSTKRDVPDAVGTIYPTRLRVATGEEVLVLRHENPGQLTFSTVVLEVTPATHGLVSAMTEDTAYVNWGTFKAGLADDTSYVRSIQQIARVQPVSLSAHEAWLAERVPANTPQILIDSYRDLLNEMNFRSESHRTALVLRIPHTTRWDLFVREHYPNDGSNAHALAVVAEAQRVMLQAEASGLGRCRMMSEQEVAKAIRSCLDAHFSWDDPRPAQLQDCWASWETSRRHLTVHGAAGDWYLRTATLRGADLPSRPVAITWLRPLLSGVYPAVIRTIAVTEEITPAGAARAAATSAAAEDQAAIQLQKTVNDGSAAVQASASAQLLADLSPGSGHHRDGWALHVTVAAESLQQLRIACQRLDSVATNGLGAKWTWADASQDTAVVATLPLGRGLRTRARKIAGQ
ncbi:SCO6880 family protein [Kribbella sp. NPDC050820]|uniref:SCO6880 family protein n=1 Tax=Kribbella sp. NPDC050820 TaxID=3155408 RepID=UPI0033FEA378